MLWPRRPPADVGAIGLETGGPGRVHEDDRTGESYHPKIGHLRVALAARMKMPVKLRDSL